MLEVLLINTVLQSFDLRFREEWFLFALKNLKEKQMMISEKMSDFCSAAVNTVADIAAKQSNMSHGNLLGR